MRRTLFLAALAACLLGLSSAQSSSFLQRGVGAWRDDLNNGKTAAKRGAAAFALGRIGEDARDAIPDLAKKAASDSDPGVREMAAAALGEILLALGPTAGNHWDGVGGHLRAALKDNDPRVRRSAAYAIGACGKAGVASADVLRERLRDKNASVRQNAAWALGKQGQTDAETVLVLGDALGDDNSLVRRDAALALYNLGRESDPRIAANTAKRLLDAMRTEKEEAVRRSLLNALAARVSDQHASYAADIAPLAESPDQDTARTAAFVLGEMGVAGEIGRVLSRSKDNEIRRICCVALSHLPGEKGRPGIAALAEAMKPDGKPDRDSEEVRVLATQAVSQIRYPANEAALPAVRTAIMEDKNQMVRHRAVWVTLNVRNLQKYELVEPLTKVLDETAVETKVTRYDAARALAHDLGANAPDKAAEILLQMIADDSLKVFKDTEAEVKGGDESKKGGSKVKTTLGGDARYMAADALRAMGTKSKDNPRVMEALKKATTDGDEMLRKSATAALEALR